MNQTLLNQKKFRRISREEPDHARRCQAIAGSGDQCWFHAWDDEGRSFDKCWMHSQAQIRSVRQQGSKMYDLANIRQNMDHIRSDEGFKNRLEEVCVMRMTLRTILENSQGSMLAVNSTKIAELCRTISTLLSSEVKDGRIVGELVDRRALEDLCDRQIAILAEFVPQDRLLECADKLAAATAAIVEESITRGGTE